MADVPINIPRTGLSVEEVTLVEWLVADGASVSEGDPICSIETDKVEVEIEAPASGVLRHGAGPGDECPIATPIGVITTSEGDG